MIMKLVSVYHDLLHLDYLRHLFYLGYLLHLMYLAEEFDAECYASHGLPPLPDDRSDTNVHGILKPPQVAHLPLNMT